MPMSPASGWFHSRSPESYDVTAAAATKSALYDAGLDYDKVQQAYVVSYVYGNSTCGQCALYHVGPIHTRLTEGSADGDSTSKVGVNPNLLA